jgi:hypothetical protein
LGIDELKRPSHEDAHPPPGTSPVNLPGLAWTT